MGIHHAITASQETPTEALLALIHTTDLLARYTEFLIQRVTEAVVLQQLVQAALSKNEPFLKFYLGVLRANSDMSDGEHIPKLYTASLVSVKRMSEGCRHSVVRDPAELVLVWLRLVAPRRQNGWIGDQDQVANTYFRSGSPVDHGSLF
jgi:hypothetical protein